MSPSSTLQEPLTLAALGRVEWDTLEPREQPTPPALRKRADYYEQRFIKYPHCGCFHSYAELIHAILLDIDAEVLRFVPQPYRLRLSGRPAYYTPDCYVHRRDWTGVIELKPRGEFDAVLQQRVAAFFHLHHLQFSVVANETVLAREPEALNWLPIIQVLVQAQIHGYDTDAFELRLWQYALDHPQRTVADFLVPGDCSHDARLRALAFYRLLHRHLLVVDLSQSPLRYDAEVRPCISPGVNA